jgi:hypothetical protein
MKKLVLIALSKVILGISPVLWNIRYKWSFHLHQRLGGIVIRWHHKYKLDVIKDHKFITKENKVENV